MMGSSTALRDAPLVPEPLSGALPLMSLMFDDVFLFLIESLLMSGIKGAVEDVVDSATVEES
jgi:hypothetical protein